MTDWPEIAKARGFDVTREEAARYGAILEALERALAPLVRELPLDAEPAPVFRPAPEEEA